MILFSNLSIFQFTGILIEKFSLNSLIINNCLMENKENN